MGRLTCGIGRIENPINDKLLSLSRAELRRVVNDECPETFLARLQESIPAYSVETIYVFFEDKLEAKECEAIKSAIGKIEGLGMSADDFISIVKQVYF